MGIKGSKKNKPEEGKHGSDDNPRATKGNGKGKKVKVLQVLVAGAAQSGKSTFFKQLQLIHFNGFKPDQKAEVTKTLRSNIILGFKELVEFHDTLKKPPHTSSTIKEQMEYFRKKNPFDVYDETTQEAAKELWDDKGFSKLWASRDTIPNLSILHLDYLMSNLERLSSDVETANNEDVLYARKRTTGTNAIEFNFKGKDFRFVDVGGQKSERRHWDQIIDKPDAVVFFVALTDWNLPTVGNPSITKLMESLEIFKDVVDYEAFRGTYWILMLNKIDLFKDKILRVSLKETFSDFTGNEKDSDDGAQYIKELFLGVMPQDRNDPIQAHVTCALDTQQMTTVFAAMQTAVLERLMSDFGML